jgi:hypothetical protein
MRKPIVSISLMCLGVFAQALAMEPPSSTPVPQGTSESAAPTQTERTPADSQSDAKPAVAAPTATSAAAAPSGSRISVTTTDPVAEAQLKRLRAAGYKPELHNGEILFCRKETLVGSRFDQKICNTSDQLENTAVTAREQAAQVQRHLSSKLVPN